MLRVNFSEKLFLIFSFSFFGNFIGLFFEKRMSLKFNFDIPIKETLNSLFFFGISINIFPEYFPIRN